MSISGSFALRCPPPIPCWPLCFRSLVGLEPPPSSARTPPRWLTGALRPDLFTRKHLDLPSSRVTPVNTCPDLRPRWCPAHLPYRVQDCCFPTGANASAFTSIPMRLIPMTTIIHISGLNTEPASLPPPASDSPYGVYLRIWLLTCWLCFSQVGLDSRRISPTG